MQVWHIMNLDKEGIGKKSFFFPVEYPEEAARLIHYLATIEIQVPENVIGSNVFGLEIFADGEWCEWSDNDGNDVDFYVDNLPKVKTK